MGRVKAHYLYTQEGNPFQDEPDDLWESVDLDDPAIFEQEIEELDDKDL
jgi:hypothetical protein